MKRQARNSLLRIPALLAMLWFGLGASVTLACNPVAVPSDGSDGDLIILETDPGLVDDSENAGFKLRTIDLSQAVNGIWSDDNQGADIGKGIYDTDQWAVTFEYGNVHIGPNVRVDFTNHRSRCPIVWLVNGDVTIEGIVDVRGKNGIANQRLPREPGPGGFRGGAGFFKTSSIRSAGFGPGGGIFNAGSGSALIRASLGDGGAFGARGSLGESVPYGNTFLFPLIGGSGGTGGTWSNLGRQGSSGGDAFLVAAAMTVTINGTINAAGGNGNASGFLSSGGSGGAIRLVGNRVEGSGSLFATGGAGWGRGGAGRIRIESCFPIEFPVANSNPLYHEGLPTDPVQVFLPIDTPRIQVTRVTGVDIDVPVPGEPQSKLDPEADLDLQTTESLTVEIAAANVPLDWTVEVRVVPIGGRDSIVTATMVPGGTEAASTWEATFLPPPGFIAVQAVVRAPTE
jgi:hypothetical protein